MDRPIVSLSGLILNNHDSDPQHLVTKRKPAWLRAKVPGGEAYSRLKSIIDRHALHTVCQEAGCPNMGECWARGVATIMILGDTCTRACGFCNVKTGRPVTLDLDEPRRVAESMRLMCEDSHLKHIVITSVNRDELADGGASIWAETIVRTRELCPDLSIEVLIPDFEGNWDALQKVIDARPTIINHNLETVRRMYPAVRPSAKFERSVELLRRVKQAGMIAKTGIMVGIGERDEEVLELMGEVQEKTGRSHAGTEPRSQGGEADGSACRVAHAEEPGGSRAAAHQPACSTPLSPRRSVAPLRSSCDILTIGQYLQPTRNHLPIDRWVTPEQFEMFKREGLARGFKIVESGPLVRSSYHADHQSESLVKLSG
ncbi:MAG: lipoyl synthase [Phycisphaerales bacterium]